MKRLLLLMGAPVLLAAGCASPAATPAAAPVSSAPISSAPTNSAPSSSAPTPASSGAAGQASSSSSSGTPRCHTGDLKLKVGDGDGAAGTSYRALVFTNAAKHTCTLYGYPGVSWVAGNGGKQVNVPFTRNSVDKKATITLKPGAVAHATLATHDVGFFDAAKCKPVDVRGYRVYPPDETASIFVSLPTRVCSVNGVDTGSVTTITAGASS
jgi:hypothetical protein